MCRAGLWQIGRHVRVSREVVFWCRGGCVSMMWESGWRGGGRGGFVDERRACEG